ncbi:MAG: DUF2786 domain-containing protein [Polyangiaceae bacterium]|nr:DUF2786 domain-containing protein [Polyangiaceae bacterium]
MSLEAVIAKVQKLRALAQSSNANEAANAAAAADTLIQEYRLSEADLEAKGASGEVPEEAVEPLFDGGARSVSWRRVLAGRLARHYDVAAYIERNLLGNRQVDFAYRVVGRPSDVATLRYMFAWLGDEIERLAKAQPARERASFALGVVVGISRQLYESRRVANSTATPGAAIVLASRFEQSVAALDAKHAIKKTIRAPRAGNISGFAKGVQTGEQLDLKGSGPRLGAAAKAEIGGAS